MSQPSPFGSPAAGWRAAPNCGRCGDSGRYREQRDRCAVEAHCTCKTGRRLQERWLADKFDTPHPDAPEPTEPEHW